MQKALDNYLALLELGFWPGKFISLYHRPPRSKEQLGHPEQEVIDTYLRAADAAGRGTARRKSVRRYKGRNEQGYQIAKRGLDLPMPPDALFVEPWIYETGLLDEVRRQRLLDRPQQGRCLDASLRILATWGNSQAAR